MESNEMPRTAAPTHGIVRRPELNMLFALSGFENWIKTNETNEWRRWTVARRAGVAHAVKRSTIKLFA